MAQAAAGSGSGLAPEALLDRGNALEGRQQHGEALLAYYRAIIESQRQGRWLDKATTPAELQGRVAYAMRYVKAGRRRVFRHALEPIYARHSREALARFEQCLASQIGESSSQPPDPRQRPSILFFPGLPSAPFFERSLFPWFAQLESEAGAIREELLALMPLAAECAAASAVSPYPASRSIDTGPETEAVIREIRPSTMSSGAFSPSA